MSEGLYDVLLRELERAVAANANPASSSLWMQAGPELRRQWGHGLIDAETFWLRLRRWLEFAATKEEDRAA